MCSRDCFWQNNCCSNSPHLKQQSCCNSSSLDADRIRDSWGSVHKNVSHLLIFHCFWADTFGLVIIFVALFWKGQQLSLSLLLQFVKWVRSRKEKKTFGLACGIMWKLKPQATLWSLKSHFTAQIADGWVCEGIKDEGRGEEGVNEGMREREKRLWRKT